MEEKGEERKVGKRVSQMFTFFFVLLSSSTSRFYNNHLWNGIAKQWIKMCRGTKSHLSIVSFSSVHTLKNDITTKYHKWGLWTLGQFCCFSNFHFFTSNMFTNINRIRWWTFRCNVCGWSRRTGHEQQERLRGIFFFHSVFVFI